MKMIPKVRLANGGAGPEVQIILECSHLEYPEARLNFGLYCTYLMQLFSQNITRWEFIVLSENNGTRANIREIDSGKWGKSSKHNECVLSKKRVRTGRKTNAREGQGREEILRGGVFQGLSVPLMPTLTSVNKRWPFLPFVWRFCYSHMVGVMRDMR